MDHELARTYDALYTYNPVPDPYIAIIDYALRAPGLPDGNILEIGGGGGRNALMLGFLERCVEVVDISAVGVAIVNTEAANSGLNVQARVGDITEEGITGNHAIIICTFTLHHLKEAQGKNLILQMRDHTLPGGCNVIVTYTRTGDYYASADARGNYYPADGELCDLYQEWGWHIPYYTEQWGLAGVNTYGTPLHNLTALLVAQKETASP